MSGTFMPIFSRPSAIAGTAAAAASVFTVMRTNSEPARESCAHWITVARTSAVSVLVMDCTTTGWLPPTVMGPTFTGTDWRRLISGMEFSVPHQHRAVRVCSGLGVMCDHQDGLAEARVQIF